MSNRKGVLQVSEILNDYTNDIQNSITQDALKVAEQGKNELKNTQSTYKIRTGKYNQGWRVDKKQGKGFVHATIYNATDWQLTHLLEKGHIKRNGKGRTRAFKHIEPVESKCVSQFKSDVEQIIGNGGKS